MIAVILVALASTVLADRSSRIVGGANAVEGSHPYIGSLQENSNHICGCVLVNTNWVLTAAHCVDGKIMSRLSVTLGDHNLQEAEGTEQTRSLSGIIVHNQYSTSEKGFPNDIALLELSAPVTTGNGIEVIQLAEEGSIFQGNTITISGWGKLASGALPHILQDVTMTKLNRAECIAAMPSEIDGAYIHETHACVYDTYDQSAGSCNGDSGGPATFSETGKPDVLIGVTSWGMKGCSPDYPSVYTRVSEYRDWISQYVN